MAYRTRIKYTAAQRADIWDRWQRGESLNSIGRLFEMRVLRRSVELATRFLPFKVRGRLRTGTGVYGEVRPEHVI